MGHKDRVLWEEGMFLAPQHFQQWDRFQSRLLDSRVASVQPFHWGFAALDIDEDALLGGEFAIKSARGVFHDGTAFDAPDIDPLPGGRAIGEAFNPGHPTLPVCLGIPRGRIGAMVADPERQDRSLARYTREMISVVDENSGSLEREIASGRQNLRILFAGEPTDEYHVLPAAHLQRAASGGFTLSTEFVPPCLRLAASPVLQSIVRRVFEILSAKSKELSAKRGQRLPGQASFNMSEATGFWLLHTVNSYLPLVMHCFHESRTHPEAVYKTLASLVGELCTFGNDKHPQDIPLYVHDEPGPTFAKLEQEIRDLPGELIPDRCKSIPLQLGADGTWTGRVHDESLLDTAEFYIAISADVPLDRIMREIPFQAKVSSPQGVADIRMAAVRGVPMTHVPSPPADILTRQGFQYFQLTPDERHWVAIRDTRTIAVFIPQHFLDAQVECMALTKD